jgi:hypothetical protein
MKALTLWQPWATLIANGTKTIETRSWSTSYRGPLAIHAAAAIPPGMDGPAGMIGRFSMDRERRGQPWYLLDRDWPGRDRGAYQYPIHLPLGAVVATCRLVDVVAIHEADCDCLDAVTWPAYWMLSGSPSTMPSGDPRFGLPRLALLRTRSAGAVEVSQANGTASEHVWIAKHPDVDLSDQLPYGDFRCGRFAWLLDDVHPLHPPTTATGRQQLWEWRQ